MQLFELNPESEKISLGKEIKPIKFKDVRASNNQNGKEKDIYFKTVYLQLYVDRKIKSLKLVKRNHNFQRFALCCNTLTYPTNSPFSRTGKWNGAIFFPYNSCKSATT